MLAAFVSSAHLLATTQLGDDSAWAVYAAGALLVLAGAGGVVLLRNPVHCALSLVLVIFGVMLLFIDQGANFLAAVQVIVYGGAIVILFLFVIMLLGVDRKEARAQTRLRLLNPAAVLITVVAFAEVLVLARAHFWASGAKSTTEALNGPGQDVQKLGQSIFTGYLLPFEMTSALLVIAVVAAVVLVRRSTEPGGGPTKRPAHIAARPPARPEAPTTKAVPAAAASVTPKPDAAEASAPVDPPETVVGR